MLEPPFDTKGKVTPVRGSTSTVPRRFRITCISSTAAAALALMV